MLNREKFLKFIERVTELERLADAEFEEFRDLIATAHATNGQIRALEVQLKVSKDRRQSELKEFDEMVVQLAKDLEEERIENLEKSNKLAEVELENKFLRGENASLKRKYRKLIDAVRMKLGAK